MILNLLDRVSSDNKPDITFGMDTSGLFTLIITTLAIIITLTAAYIISKQYKQIATFENKKSNIGTILIWVITLIICLLLILLCFGAMQKN